MSWLVEMHLTRHILALLTAAAVAPACAVDGNGEGGLEPSVETRALVGGLPHEYVRIVSVSADGVATVTSLNDTSLGCGMGSSCLIRSWTDAGGISTKTAGQYIFAGKIIGDEFDVAEVWAPFGGRPWVEGAYFALSGGPEHCTPAGYGLCLEAAYDLLNSAGTGSSPLALDALFTAPDPQRSFRTYVETVGALARGKFHDGLLDIQRAYFLVYERDGVVTRAMVPWVSLPVTTFTLEPPVEERTEFRCESGRVPLGTTGLRTTLSVTVPSNGGDRRLDARLETIGPDGRVTREETATWSVGASTDGAGGTLYLGNPEFYLRIRGTETSQAPYEGWISYPRVVFGRDAGLFPLDCLGSRQAPTNL